MAKESFHLLWAHGLTPLRVLGIPSLAHDGGEDIAERHAFGPFQFVRATKAMAVGELRRSPGEDRRPLGRLDSRGYGLEVHEVVQRTRCDQLYAYG